MGLRSRTRTSRVELRYNTEIIYNLDYLVYLLPITAGALKPKSNTPSASQANIRAFSLAPLQYSAFFRLLINLKKQLLLLDNEQIIDCLQSPIFL